MRVFTLVSYVCFIALGLVSGDDVDLISIPQSEQLQNELPIKSITKKSVNDAREIQAAEAYEFEYLTESSPNDEQQLQIEPIASASHNDHHDHHHHSKVGYSAGGPLVNIAQGAAQQAHTFEKNQPAAAAQAAYIAKNRLGQSAGLSAATAAAAFAGKQIILRGLEQQAYSAHRALESEKLQLLQAQRAATAAAQAARQAMHQLQVITTALNTAQATSQHASQAAGEAAAELAAQTAMVGAAKARLQAIEDQLHHARIDFEATQAANLKAARAARIAQSNAAAAAAHAAEIANAHHHHHHHHHHKQQEEHLEKIENNDTDDVDDDHDESVVITRVENNDKAEESELENKATQVLQQASDAADYPTNLATLLAVTEDELYDSHDSFPY